MSTLREDDLWNRERPGEPRLYDKQRVALEERRAYIRRLQITGQDQNLDPVMRYHLGLEKDSELDPGLNPDRQGGDSPQQNT